ncbi:MAG: hypothetical protein SynsKO_11490 [Synoicihabitans sp.]
MTSLESRAGSARPKAITMTQPISRLLTAPLLALFVFLAGCENIPKDLAGLEVDIVNVRSLTETATGGELVVTVRCRNETVRPIGIREVQIALEMNGLKVGRGISSRPIATQAMSTNTADITFIIKDPAKVDTLAGYFASGSVNYAITTNVMIMSGGQLLRSRSNSGGVVSTNNVRR